MKGFYIRNIRFMVRCAKEYDNYEIMKQLVSQIPSVGTQYLSPSEA